MIFTLRDVFCFSVITLLLTLIVYHSFIYFGRQGKERLYYIYFCSFALNFIFYLLCVTSLHRFVFPNEEIRRLISPAVTTTTYFLLLHYVLKTFKIIFSLPSSQNKYLSPFYISFSIFILLTASYLFLDYDYYMINVFPIEVIFGTFSPVYMFIFFIIYFFRTKQIRHDLPSKITLLMFLIFMLDFVAEEVFSVLNIHYALKGTYFVSGISALIWAFALAIRFNNEHKELHLLKNYLEEKIDERTFQLQIANEQRASTFINLAHETRTPLTLINNNLDDYYQKHKDNIEIDNIKYNVEKINQLIGNILNIDKFEKGHDIYIHDKIIDVSSFISSKIDYFSSYASKKNLKIICDIQKSIYLKIAPDALESLLDNLIINAIKFTLKGSITVSLFSKESLTILAIKDTGVGIPLNIRDRIFEPYFHFSNNPCPGFGMGLTIVKNIVDSLQGNITFNSKRDVGTEFFISFDHYQALSNEDVYHDYKMNPSVIENTDLIFSDVISDDNKPYILIIEDNLDLVLYLSDKLKKDYNIYVASDGFKALQKIENCPAKPDLIISDVMMDSMDGFKFYELLKESKYNYTPLIFITAKANSADRDKALEMGAIDYIYKPFEISEVRKKIASIIKNSKKQRNLAIDNIKNILDNESILLHATVDKHDNFESNCKLYKISNREIDIIELARNGKTYNEIADILNISRKTVDTHFQNIFKKADVNKLQALLNKLFF